MPRLHLVGFTTDLKNLVLATRKGAKSGNYLIAIDDRLRRTLKEVDKLESEDGEGPSASISKLTPKEIQALLRSGKSVEQVARLAETDVGFIDRFTGPIMAERRGVIDQVRSATISKRRLGPSALAVGDAIETTLRERRIPELDEVLDQGWHAVRKSDRWEVRFRYTYRGSRREAHFSFDPEERSVEPLNAVATDIAWRPAGSERAKRKPSARRKSPRKPSTRKKAATKSRAGKSRSRGRR